MTCLSNWVRVHYWFDKGFCQAVVGREMWEMSGKLGAAILPFTCEERSRRYEKHSPEQENVQNIQTRGGAWSERALFLNLLEIYNTCCIPIWTFSWNFTRENVRACGLCVAESCFRAGAVIIIATNCTCLVISIVAWLFRFVVEQMS